ncbi:MAG: TonB-dependent receptor, partial [Devosia sp.]|nr:TonB-dependent receptor [Devosia sp.]
LGVFGGSGDFSYGTYNLSRERLEVNLPLGDQFALRVSGQKFDHNGFTTNVAIPGFKEDDAHDASAKAALLWKPNSNFTATLTTQWYHSNQHGDAQKNVNDPESSPWSIYQDYPSHFALTSELYHLNLEYDAPWFIVKSVTAYQYLSQVQQEDSSRSAFSILGSYDNVAAWNTKLHNYTEEFDILSKPGSRLEWTVGAFALYQKSTQFITEFEGSTQPTAADLAIKSDIMTNPPANVAYGNYSRVDRESYSLFGQATYHFTDKLRLTVGGRMNLDAYHDSSYNFSGKNFTGTGQPSFGTADQKEWDNVPTWRVEADYDVTPVNMVYASSSRGYKPGGVNGKNGQYVINPVFQPETNTAFEVGSKNFLFDRSLRLNAAAFYYIHKNFQYIETDPIPFDGGISNIPSVHDYGVEFEANYVGLENRLHVDANLAVERGQISGDYYTIDSTVANTIYATNANCAYGGQYYNSACWAAVAASAKNVKGKSPPAMPEFSGSISASYRFDIPTGSLTPRVEVIYRGSEWARVFNEAGLDHVPAYTVTNLSIEYAPESSKLRLQVAATNLFNVAGINSRYTDPYGTGQTSNQYIAPRQVIGTIAYAF